MKRIIGIFAVLLLALVMACAPEREHMADAVSEADSLPFMTATGVSTLISDSGVIRYKLVSEDWRIYNNTSPATWKFLHGFFMERFDENMHTDLFVQADTAYLHRQSTWELRGRVVIKNLQGTLFLTQELYWDMDEHKMWNHKPMDIYMPDRELHGTEFRSNEQMTDYFVMNSVGEFPASDTETAPEPTYTPPADSASANADGSNRNAPQPHVKQAPMAPDKQAHQAARQ